MSGSWARRAGRRLEYQGPQGWRATVFSNSEMDHVAQVWAPGFDMRSMGLLDGGAVIRTFADVDAAQRWVEETATPEGFLVADAERRLEGRDDGQAETSTPIFK